MMALCMIMCLFATNAFAQEKVRGIETKLVMYDEKDVDSSWDDIYGVEFTNRNSIPVSVDVELWHRRYNKEDQLSLSKSFVLEPNESYLWKIWKCKGSDGSIYECNCYSECYYYYKYEAYKLQ